MSSSISSLIHADIQAACSTLGGWDDGKYHKEPECIESLKDLLRYLRRDDESHEIRRILGQAQLLKTDLLPLLTFYPEDKMLFDVVVRLLVDLTNPAILLYKEELPIEKMSRNTYLEIVSHQQSYKQAFTDSKVWNAITKKLESLLHLDWESRQEEDKDMIERILVLIRNIVHVPASPAEERRTDDDVSIHDQVLWAMHLAHLEDLLLYVSSSDDETDYCFHSLEILSLMLREQCPKRLAKATPDRTITEKEEDVKELLRIRELELTKKKLQMQSRMTRHPRFGGTFTVKNLKSVGDNELIAHDHIRKLSQLDFDRGKVFRAKPKNRRPIARGDEGTRSSTLNIRLFLKGLCVDFLKWSYNPMMRTVKSFLERSKAQSHDESYYFWALRFFMEFNRHNGFDVSLVSETISKETFHFVQKQLEDYYEMMVTDKRKIHIWAKRLHVGLKAYQELLKTLAAMDSSPEDKVKNAAKVLKCTLFYLPEYREIVLHLLLNFNDSVQPIPYLRDLVEMVHVFTKMLEHFAKQQSHMIVKDKGKARKKSKGKATRMSGARQGDNSEEQQQLWLSVACSLSSALQGEEELPVDIVPYDSTLDNTEEEKKLDALSRIQVALKSKEAGRAVALLRAAREVWPDHDMFGPCNLEGDQEFSALRNIFFTDLTRFAPPPPASENGFASTEAVGDRDEDDEEGGRDDRGASGDEAVHAEKEFHFDEFIRRFANPKVIIVYCKLLAEYRNNSDETNHQVVRMLHRLAWNLKVHPMLYQASVFKVFQNILRDYRSLPKHCVGEALKELARFATFVVRNFVDVAQINKFALVELLFWKNSKEAYELVHGYGTSAAKKPSTKLWTEEQEFELKVLYERYKDDVTPEKDVVDVILENMIDKTRTRRNIICQLKNLGLLTNTSKLKKSAKTNCPWGGEEIVELQELFEKYKNSTDILGQIMEHMMLKRPKHRVIDKILELGLVRDRKELRKKRARKNGTVSTKTGSVWARRNSESSVVSASSGDEIHLRGDSSSDNEPSTSSRGNKPGSSQNSASVAAVPVPADATTSEDLTSLFAKLIDTGCRESLEWLLSSFEDAAEDWDVEDPTAVPLVPVVEAQHLSLENSDFCSLLRTVGLEPPADEQEIYWRIPSGMTGAMLNSRVDVLKGALEGDFSVNLLVFAPIATSPRTNGAHLNATKQRSMNAQPHKGASSKTQEPATPRTEAAVSSELKDVFTRLSDKGCQESLKWLLSFFKEALAERDGDDPVPEPLVPLMDVHHASLRDEDFSNLLRILGLEAPDDGRRTYWTIPSRISDAMLNSRISVMEKALDGDYDVPLLNFLPSSPKSKKKDDRLEVMRQLLIKRKQQEGTRDSNDTETSRPRRRRKRKSSGSSDACSAPIPEKSRTSAEESIIVSSSSDNELSSTSKRASSKRKRADVMDDSDDEESLPNRSKSSRTRDRAQTTTFFSSDMDSVATGSGIRKATRNRVVAFDESEDDHASLSDPFASTAQNGLSTTQAAHSSNPVADITPRAPRRLVVLDDSDDEVSALGEAAVLDATDGSNSAASTVSVDDRPTRVSTADTHHSTSRRPKRMSPTKSGDTRPRSEASTLDDSDSRKSTASTLSMDDSGTEASIADKSLSVNGEPQRISFTDSDEDVRVIAKDTGDDPAIKRGTFKTKRALVISSDDEDV